MDKNRLEIYEQITALVDNELPEENVNNLEILLREDEELQMEFKIQSGIKTLLRERFAAQSAPAYLYENVMTQITAQNTPVEIENNSRKTNFEKIISIFNPKFAIAAIIMIAAVLFLSTPFNNVNPEELANEQHGRYNIWVQANSNFENIVEGKLTAQFISSDPEKIQKFFEENGVQYSAKIPICNNWKLAGGVVSEDKGEKFAHHVYSDEDGHILYVYQVNEKYVGKSAILHLSNDMLSYINDKKFYKHSFRNHTTFLLKSHNNIFAIVSNDKPGKIESDFISRIL